MTEIQGYRLLQHLGSGYFGDVWKAEAGDGKPCAIKLVALDKPNGKAPITEKDLKALAKVRAGSHISVSAVG